LDALRLQGLSFQTPMVDGSRRQPVTVDLVGAGISGLATAWYPATVSSATARSGYASGRRNEQPGGLAGSFTTPSFSVERFYHHLFRRDMALQELIAEVGLGEDLVWRPALTGA
jgi:protoporphyrinogen oxidase